MSCASARATDAARVSLPGRSAPIAGALWLFLLCAPGLASIGCERGARPIVVPGKFHASPILVEGSGEPLVVLAAQDGTISALDAAQARVRWTRRVPAADGEEPYLLATPVAIDGELVVSYQTRSVETGERLRHRVLVIDLATGRIDDAFPEIELAASKPATDGSGTVAFKPSNALGRSALVHGRLPGSTLGRVYVSFGNRADIQPWHGWVFELDLDRWKAAGAEAAVSSVLLVTPETQCPVEGKSGSSDMICGGGVWTPAGPPVIQASDGFELVVPTGNGQLDLAREDYANSLMRMGPGLDFDPGCDAAACAGFDPIAPSDACLASCRNLFVPRLLPGDPPLRPASGVCDGKTFMQCYALIDFDFGACAPVRIELAGGVTVFAQPAKDGSVYLIDGEHMGTLYDRERIVEVCGTPEDACPDLWRGMIVTQPALAQVDGVPVLLVPTFVFDTTHPAGLVALKVLTDAGVPRLEPFWEAPDFASAEAVERFRFYPSRAFLFSPEGDDEIYAWVVDVVDSDDIGWRHPLRRLAAWRSGRDRGTLLGVRVRDGEIVARIRLSGGGRRHVLPLAYGDKLYIPSNPGVEIHQIRSLR